MPDPYSPAGSSRSFDVPAALDAVDVSAWFEDFADTVDGALDDSEALAVPKTLVDAKGDLLVGTAADTVGRLAVGTDGYMLTADSSQAGGVKWAAAPDSGFHPFLFLGA